MGASIITSDKLMDLFNDIYKCNHYMEIISIVDAVSPQNTLPLVYRKTTCCLQFSANRQHTARPLITSRLLNTSLFVAPSSRALLLLIVVLFVLIRMVSIWLKASLVSSTLRNPLDLSLSLSLSTCMLTLFWLELCVLVFFAGNFP